VQRNREIGIYKLTKGNAKEVVIEEAKRLQVITYISHRDFLKSLYLASKERIGSYSYLKFSEDLGLSKSNVLRLVITGQRPLSPKAAEKIGRQLELQGVSKKYWITLVKYADARTLAERDLLFTELIKNKAKGQPRSLDAKQVEYFSNWYHPIIREMAGLKDFTGDPEWIKKRLTFPLRIDEIKHSLDLLVRIGALKYDKIKNRFDKTEELISTDTEADHMALVSYHQKMIDSGRESITRVEEELREIRAITANLPIEKIPLLKNKILEFMSEVLDMEENKLNESEVYQMNIQLFPFTKS
jgi:uncharacterized protein (TIGR02147 family)